MTIYPVCTNLLKYRFYQKITEYYYRRKTNCPCFLMQQNNRWTIVTFNM
ncbi:MAG: hypothetical protein KH366_25560 [Clostridiaceae bacterium]|nr:hypothetical protein [Clostridiaceae bacterium]